MNGRKPIPTRAQLKKLFTEEAESAGLYTDVFSDGPVGATIAVIGEGPGESEIRSGIPFAGGSGKILLDELRKYSLGRHNVYITNVVKRQISLSSKSDARHHVKRAELSKWIAMLHWELAQLPNLTHILVLGNYALEATIGEVGITDWRGTIMPYRVVERDVTVGITFNPAYVLREPRLIPILKMDLYKFNRAVIGKFTPHEVECIINPSLKDVRLYLKDVRKADAVSLDIESTSGQVACVGLAIDPHEAMCINFRDDTENRFDEHEEQKIWLELQDTLEKVKIVAQNGGFDSSYCWQKVGLKFNCWFDTMLAHHLLYPQLPHSLQFLTAQYTTHPFYKDEGKLWREGGDIDTFWRYNCKDAALTLAVQRSLSKSLDKHGLTDFFHNHVMRVQPHLVQATVNGIACDVKLKEKLKEELSEEVERIREHFSELCRDALDDPDYVVNPNSPTQLQSLFFERLKLKGRGFSTDALNRTKMLSNPNTRPAAKEILTTLEKYKKESKFLSTYVEVKLDEDNRFRCTYKQHGVSRAPGRLSSSKTIDGTGLNLQNIPRRGYEMFVSDPGCAFIYLDASQAEARVVGWYYEIEEWKEQFERARQDKEYDVHRALASEMFKVPYEAIPKEDFDENNNPTRRFIGKRCRHGLNYRMQAARLADVTGLPYYAAQKAYKLYHALTPELQRGWAKEEQKVRRTRELVNAYGRPWKVISRLDESALESIIAFYPQSTVGDHVQRAWYLSEEDDEWPTGKARIAMNIHDALVGIAEFSVAKHALSIMKRYMEAPIKITNLYGTNTDDLIIPSECKISEPDEQGVHRWSGLKSCDI